MKKLLSKTKPSRAKIRWIVVAVALIPHAIFLILDHNYYANDTASYLISADNLLHGQGFVNNLHHPEISRTPGYPLLLALFEIAPLRLEYLIVLQHGFCLVMAFVVAGLALEITESSLIALTAASVLSLDVATLTVANMLLTEITFAFLIGLVCWLLYRVTGRSGSNMVVAAVSAGLIGGCAVLVRPVGVLYFVPLSIYLFLVLRRRALRPTLIFVASFLLLPLLWATRNYSRANYFGVTTIGAGNLLFYRAAGTLAVRMPGDYLANALKVRGALSAQACEDLERAYGRNCSQVTDSQQAAYYERTGTSIILNDLPGYLRSAALGVAYMVFGGGVETLSRIGNVSPLIAKRVILLITIPEACLAVIGCLYWFRRQRHLCYLLLFTIGYFFAISAGGEAYSRFRVPVMPMYALLVGGGAAAMIQSIRRSGHRASNRHESSADHYSGKVTQRL